MLRAVGCWPGFSCRFLRRVGVLILRMPAAHKSGQHGAHAIDTILPSRVKLHRLPGLQCLDEIRQDIGRGRQRVRLDWQEPHQRQIARRISADPIILEQLLHRPIRHARRVSRRQATIDHDRLEHVVQVPAAAVVYHRQPDPTIEARKWHPRRLRRSQTQAGLENERRVLRLATTVTN